MIKRFCIVPARGGSKRLPGKNLLPLAGKPLIYHTLDAVMPFFDKVIFSTDDEKILTSVRSEKKYNTPLINKRIRPEHLATDTSKVIDTVSYYFDEHIHFDEVWLALPTCPLRQQKHVKEAIELLENNKQADGVISITDCEFPPQLSLVKTENNEIKDWDKSQPWQNGNTRSQDHPKLYRPNGALYGMRTEHFNKVRNFYKGNILGYFMERKHSVDIDTKLDFQLASLLMRNK